MSHLCRVARGDVATYQAGCNVQCLVWPAISRGADHKAARCVWSATDCMYARSACFFAVAHTLQSDVYVKSSVACTAR